MEIKTMLSVLFVFILVVVTGGLLYAAYTHDGDCAGGFLFGGGLALFLIVFGRSEMD